MVSLDLETTSLDPAQAEILSIAAVPVDAHGVRLSRRFVRSVRGRGDFGIDSIRVHRILPGESAQGEGLDEVIDEFLLWLGNRPILGYFIAFDRGLLSRETRRRHGFAMPNRSVEMAERYRRSLPVREGRPDQELRLETIAAKVGLPLMGRHTALGDAVSVGLIYCALQARAGLRRQGPGE